MSATGSDLFPSGGVHPAYKSIGSDRWKGKKVHRTGALLFGTDYSL